MVNIASKSRKPFEFIKMEKKQKRVIQNPAKKIIAICGRISAGKTTLAKQISERYNFPIASFGGFIKHYCELNKLPTNRKSLQDVGRNFINDNPKKFLKDVILFYRNGSEIVILEGVRHRVIIKHIDAVCDESLVIFVDADPKTIYQRFTDRGKESDAEIDYDKYDNHPVEFEIEQLKLLSHFVFDTNKNQEEEVFSIIDKFLH
jgi:dephospho-CoA kinase